jgi:hypothetical protein
MRFLIWEMDLFGLEIVSNFFPVKGIGQEDWFGGGAEGICCYNHKLRYPDFSHIIL